MAEINPDIILLNETSNKKDYNIKYSGYTSISKSIGTKDGTAILIRNTLTTENIHLEYISTVRRNLLKYIKIHDCRRLLTLTCIRVSVSVPGADNIIGTKVFQAIILQQIFIHKTALDVFLWLQTRSVFGTNLTHNSTLLHK